LIDALVATGTAVFVTTHYMDEAERCHRVALMHAGKLLALDTVPRLKAVFPAGSMVEIRCPRPTRAMAALSEMAGVAEVALFGSVLHAVLADPGRRQGLAGELASRGFAPAQVEVITPSLEDAFIRVISLADNGGQS
jgi:ABC-2 type transport system ATP-binding protein